MQVKSDKNQITITGPEKDFFIYIIADEEQKKQIRRTYGEKLNPIFPILS